MPTRTKISLQSKVSLLFTPTLFYILLSFLIGFYINLKMFKSWIETGYFI
jgi:hypothetical protein